MLAEDPSVFSLIYILKIFCNFSYFIWKVGKNTSYSCGNLEWKLGVKNKVHCEVEISLYIWLFLNLCPNMTLSHLSFPQLAHLSSPLAHPPPCYPPLIPAHLPTTHPFSPTHCSSLLTHPPLVLAHPSTAHSCSPFCLTSMLASHLCLPTHHLSLLTHLPLILACPPTSSLLAHLASCPPISHLCLPTHLSSWLTQGSCSHSPVHC